jgi:adenylate kinase family enzyme
MEKGNTDVFIFIGRSGCGKGTQAKLLMEEIKKKSSQKDILYIQTGAELRDFIKGDSYTQKICADIYNRGDLQPEFLAVYMWIRRVIEKYTGKEHMVFDGTPRKLHEAGVLHSIISFYKLGKPNVINIDISKDEAKKRLLSRGRMDDDEKEIEKRLAWYDTDVLPAIQFYQNNKEYNFHHINGEQSVEKVWEDLSKSLQMI